jgi:hypothetical protein
VKRPRSTPARRVAVRAVPPAFDPAGEPEILHRLRNHLSVVVSFCDLLLADMPHDDPRRADLVEVQNAGRAGLNLLPEVASRFR